jgi:NAD(P)H-hydrate epimerase
VADVRELVAAATVPVVVDADGLYALGTGNEIGAALHAGPDPTASAGSVPGRGRPTVVLTPHDGEFTRLAGAPPGTDRIAAADALAQRCGAVVLLKGSTTVVADPAGRVLLATAGSPRLATAGTGDVLSGVIGAFVARGVDPHHAAALAAHVHGRAAELGSPEGLVAGDLAELIGRWLSGIRR